MRIHYLFKLAENMRQGFTGAQKGAPINVITDHLKTLLLTENDTVVTGACIGVDAQIFKMVDAEYSHVPQIIVCPAYMMKVDPIVIHLAKQRGHQIIYMPKGSSYRQRNERLVLESDCITAFWTGVRRSGTYMTINIAKRAGKLRAVIKI